MLSVILIFLIAAQPVQAGFCDMEPSDGPAHHAPQHALTQHDPHDDMQRGMQRGMGDTSPDQAAGHACCAGADSQPDQDCDGIDHCGSCIAGMAALPASSGHPATVAYAYRTSLTEGQLTPSHTAPPYRPPTAIS